MWKSLAVSIHSSMAHSIELPSCSSSIGSGFLTISPEGPKACTKVQTIPSALECCEWVVGFQIPAELHGSPGDRQNSSFQETIGPWRVIEPVFGYSFVVRQLKAFEIVPFSQVVVS
jgi:hypothetical protein